MNLFSKIAGSKNVLLGLIVFLLIVVIGQSAFIVKQYRSANTDISGKKLSKQLGNSYGFKDDFLKPYDQNIWDPFEELHLMREQMDRMFDDSFNRFRLSPFFDEGIAPNGSLLPQTDLVEENTKYVVKMNIPGSDKANMEVKQDKERGDTFLRMERSMGSIQRSIPIPGPVDSGAMETKYEDGVLTIILPKRK